MATTYSNLNDTIIAEEGLTAFIEEIAPLMAFSTSFGKDAQRKGEGVTVPVVAGITASTTENDYETSGGSAAGTLVTLNSYAKSTVGLTDNEFTKSSSSDLRRFAVAQSQAIAKKILTDAWGLVVAAKYSTKVTKALNAFSSADVRAMRVSMNKANVPVSDRSLILNPDYADVLVGDTTIVTASALHYGSADVIQNGRIPKYLGFQLHESNLVPANGENLVGFAAHPSAMAIAIRPLQPQIPGQYLESRIVTEPKTGISLGYRRHYSAAKGTHFVTFEAVYGVKELLAGGIVRLVSA